MRTSCSRCHDNDAADNSDEFECRGQNFDQNIYFAEGYGAVTLINEFPAIE